MEKEIQGRLQGDVGFRAMTIGAELIEQINALGPPEPVKEGDVYIRRFRIAGDALNSHAFGVLASLPYGEGLKDAGLQVIKELSEYAGFKGMIRGQIVDWISMNEEAEPETVTYLHRNKTAALIVCSIRAGAMLSAADDDSLDGLTRLGKMIGLAFQIKDDILDVESSPEQLGKSIGKDKKQGKATYPAVFGMERSKSEMERLSAEAKKIAEKFARKCPWLYYIIDYLLQRRN